MYIYRRGVQFWWGRSFAYRDLQNRPITIRISLKSSCRHDAMKRAAALEMCVDSVMDELTNAQKHGLTFKQIQKLAQETFKFKLDRFCKDQLGRTAEGEQFSTVNKAYARYYRMIAANGELPQPKSGQERAFCEQGLTEKDAFALASLVATHAHTPAISERHIRNRLVNLGVAPSNDNIKAMVQPMALAYSRACVEASSAIGQPIDDDVLLPVPDSLYGIFPDWSPAGIFEGNVARSAAQKTQEIKSPTVSELNVTPADRLQNADVCKDIGADSTSLNTDACDNENSAITFSQLCELARIAKIDDGDWREGRTRDVRAALKLFIWANGDVFVSQLQQVHMSKLVELTRHLPNGYGKMREDDVLRMCAEKSGGGGLHVKTRNKHLSCLSAVLAWGRENGYYSGPARPAALQKSTSRLSKTKGTTLLTVTPKPRLPWTAEEVVKLFDTPIWTGCDSLAKRFRPGSEVIHDGYYWVLPMLAVTGARSSEITGLSLDEMITEHNTPHISLKFTEHRELKSESGERKIPIAQNLVRLGLLDYVGEMRRAGEVLMFPELSNPAMEWSKVFKCRCYNYVFKQAFPNGTSRLRGHLDVDVHSIRGMAANVIDPDDEETPIVKSFFGHKRESTLSEHYKDEAKLKLLAKLTALLDPLLDGLTAHPLNLRDANDRRYGVVKIIR